MENGTARIALAQHFGSEKDARAVVEPFIHLWESWDALNPLLSGFRLVYSTAEVIDRDPPPGNYANLELQPIQMSAHGVVWDGSLGRYPEPPPEGAEKHADVEVMAFRHWLYRQGRDTLGAMAYFCLTVLQTGAGSRQTAAKRYHVDYKVLDKLGELTDRKGGREAKKGKGVEHEFTPSERMWIESTIKRLIRRAADLASNPDQDLPTITMAKLPTLPKK